LGVKPLYYALLDDGTLLFGSELKSILAHGGMRRDIDPLAVEEYFALGYVAEPRSIFKQAKKLSPGHTLAIKLGQPMGEPVQYWDVRFSLDNPISPADARAELIQRLKESVRLRMIAEVPLGAFLSGGVDSSAVVAIMAGLSPEPVNTCSIGFDDPAFNESAFAQTVADRYHTSHRLEVVKSDDFDLIDTLARMYDEPYADSSAIPTYRVCQLARKHVTVALSGDGGDESFGGYRRYRLHLMEERMRAALPQSVRGPVFGLLGGLYPKADWAPRMFRAKTTFEGLARNSVEAYFHTVSILRGPMRDALFSQGFKSTLAGYNAQQVFNRHAAQAGTNDPLALIQYLDLKTYLVGDINTKVDRASMAHSLEVREPLMDHELVDWLATLPSSHKINGQEGKYLFKKSMEPYLPQDVLYRPKMGFAVPLARWFRGPLKQRVRDAVLGERLLATGWFNPAYLRHLVDAHQSGARDYSAPLWTLLMFEAFLRQVVDAPSPCHSEAATGRGDSLLTTS
ncbi:MAG: asparagine synthase (glutamine-hydrolyzing), partial [Rhodoferax sp.]